MGGRGRTARQGGADGGGGEGLAGWDGHGVCLYRGSSCCGGIAGDECRESNEESADADGCHSIFARRLS